ncbi:MAG: glutamine--fructose-6-phosphate transaminase (isomerizing) [Chloroflexi bacterium]|nr:glutamine--fructose-6-phosphate transaminase (isomerizing) [Chloroflexota bacterium]|tara:strand:+ start:10398 stop:12221 length:1824 start_codon:yes stop_codon:yes gene_type:complete
MCGIVAGISEKNITPILLEGLKKLEYRGYDSSGISLLFDNEFSLLKETGKVKNLELSISKECSFFGKLGLAHTRWSTHGKVSKENAHPHNSKNFSIVHNGIIENYLGLKGDLIKKGYDFKSETDSEVILYILEESYKSSGSVFKAIQDVIQKTKGSYALGIIHRKNEEVVWSVKKDSPLVIGKTKDMSLMASDKNAIDSCTEEIYYLGDNEIAKLEKKGVTFFTSDGKILYKEGIKIDKNQEIVGKGGFEYFMEKEIYEQPEVIKNTLKNRIKKESIYLDELNRYKRELKKIENVEIISCGTSNHAALISKYWFENILNIPCEVIIASEYRYKTLLTRKNTLFITLSQSGETADTLSALKLINEKNKHLLSISVCNVEGSSIPRESDLTLLTNAGKEIGVASTKAFTSQLAVMLMLIYSIGREKRSLDKEMNSYIIKSLKKLPIKMEEFLNASTSLDSFIKTLENTTSALYIGRSEYGALAMEGALKLKEISYIHSESFYAGELKHGSLALIDENTPVIAIAPFNELFDKIYSNIEEILARNGKVLMLSDKHIISENLISIKMPECPEILKPICYSIPLQYLAFKTAKLKGTDIDKPRNLAKSVTVE